MPMAGTYIAVKVCLVLVTMTVGVLTMAREVSKAVTEDNIDDNNKQAEQEVAHCQAVHKLLSCEQVLGC